MLYFTSDRSFTLWQLMSHAVIIFSVSSAASLEEYRHFPIIILYLASALHNVMRTPDGSGSGSGRHVW